MFAQPHRVLIIAMDKDDKPMWAASIAPTEIMNNYSGELPEMDIRGLLIDGPIPMEKVAEKLSGL